MDGSYVNTKRDAVPIVALSFTATIASNMSYVLIVDDEASIRDFLTRWLQAWGYTVKSAAGANAAITLMVEEPASIMLCDVMMPGRDGLSLLEEVRERWP